MGSKDETSSPTVRPGRPSREAAGQIVTRILDAAEDLFLARGFEAATMDHVAEAARVGKRTLYSRFSTKEALFTAVVERSVDRVVGSVAHHGLQLEGRTPEERLTQVALALLTRALTPEIVALMRTVIAEARRFTPLAQSVDRRARERVIGFLAGVLQDEVARGTLREHDSQVAADLFVGAVILPLQMRALMGQDLEDLRREVVPHVREAVAVFMRGAGPRVY